MKKLLSAIRESVCQRIADHYFYLWLSSKDMRYLDKYLAWVDRKWSTK